MAGGYGAKQYKQTSITTASKGQVLIMLYEAAIRNVKKATDAIAARDLASKGRYIGKAHDILNELVATLDFKIGGNIAHDLERLYNFMTEQLVKANVEGSAEPLNTVQRLLENLLSGWREAVKIAESKGAAGGDGRMG